MREAGVYITTIRNLFIYFIIVTYWYYDKTIAFLSKVAQDLFNAIYVIVCNKKNFIFSYLSLNTTHNIIKIIIILHI